MRGIILAGGRGTRLGDLTVATNKHLLPVGPRPMITHVIQTMHTVGIDELLIVTSPEYVSAFATLTAQNMPPYNRFSCIYFAAQREPRGIADAIGYGREFCRGSDGVLVLLGDNLISDTMQIRQGLNDFQYCRKCVGAHIWTYKVDNPSDYGVLQLNENGSIANIVEKPATFISDMAIPGIYLFDNDVWGYITNLQPSPRGEFEVTDLLRQYVNHPKGCRLHWSVLQGMWVDPCRSAESYRAAVNMFLQ